ncbi:UNVERIFIED_CONTAM: hypothetical protein Cloal_2198 [Acetivibrio alkalicellulosi]
MKFEVKINKNEEILLTIKSDYEDNYIIQNIKIYEVKENGNYWLYFNKTKQSILYKLRENYENIKSILNETKSKSEFKPEINYIYENNSAKISEKDLEFLIFHVFIEIMETDKSFYDFSELEIFEVLFYLKRKRLELLKEVIGIEFGYFNFNSFHQDNQDNQDIKNNKNFFIRLARVIIKDWIFLVKNDSDLTNLFFLKGGIEKNREGYMDELVFGENNEVSILFKNEDYLDILELLIQDWYLKRYDIKTSSKLYDWIIKNKRVKKLVNNFTGGISEVLKKIVCRVKQKYSICVLGYLILTLILFDFGSEVMIKLNIENTISSIIRVVNNIIISLFLVGAFISIKRIEKCRYYNVYLPRIMAAISIGYIGIIWSQDFVELVISISTFNNGLSHIILYYFSLFVIMILGYIYILLEVNNKLGSQGVDYKTITSRAIKIFISGITKSFIIGMFMFSWAFQFYSVKFVDNNIGYKFPIMFDTYVPIRVLFVFAFLSFFLGILIQILWDEKEITYPI